MNRIITLAAAVGLAGAAQAAPLAYSGLADLPLGLVTNTTADGTGWNGPWDPQNATAGYTVSKTTPLTFGQLVTSADGNYMTGTGNYTNNGRRLATGAGSVFDAAGKVSDPYTRGTVDRGIVWFSMMMSVYNTTSNSTVLRLHDNNIGWGDYQGVMIGTQGGTWTAAPTTGALAASSTAIVANTPTLLVGRYDLNGADSSFHFWALTDSSGVSLGGADLSLASATSAITGVDALTIDFKSVKLYLLNSGANRAAVDEIRFGESFADVTPVPEPAFIGFAGVAAAGLLIRRRRV